MSSLSPKTEQRYQARARNAARTRRKVAEYLRGRLPNADASLYIKAKEIARDTQFSPREVAAALRTLEETRVPVTATRWTASTPTTWQVVRE